MDGIRSSSGGSGCLAEARPTRGFAPGRSTPAEPGDGVGGRRSGHQGPAVGGAVRRPEAPSRSARGGWEDREEGAAVGGSDPGAQAPTKKLCSEVEGLKEKHHRPPPPARVSHAARRLALDFIAECSAPSPCRAGGRCLWPGAQGTAKPASARREILRAAAAVRGSGPERGCH